MDYPQLPTDSLYKFMSIAGLALIITFVLVPGKYLLDIQKQVAQVNTEYDIETFESGIESEGLVQARKDLDQLTADYKAASKNVSPKTKQRAQELDNEYKEIHEKSLALEDKFKSTHIAKIKTNGRLEEIKAYEQWTRRIINITTIGAVVGVLLMSFGFHYWRIRIQVFQDLILKNQALGESNIASIKSTQPNNEDEI